MIYKYTRARKQGLNSIAPPTAVSLKKLYIYIPYFFSYKTGFFSLFRKGKTHIIAKFHRTDLVIKCNSTRRGNSVLYPNKYGKLSRKHNNSLNIAYFVVVPYSRHADSMYLYQFVVTFAPAVSLCIESLTYKIIKQELQCLISKITDF